MARFVASVAALVSWQFLVPVTASVDGCDHVDAVSMLQLNRVNLEVAAQLAPLAAAKTLPDPDDTLAASLLAFEMPGWYENLTKAHKIAILVAVGFFFFSTFLLAVIGIALSIVARVLGKTIETGIEELDQLVLGVDVEIGSLAVGILRGYVQIEDMKVKNPPGWKEDHLLHAKKVKVDLNMWTLLRSCMSTVDIQALELRDVDVNYARSITSSNVGDLMKMLSGKKPKPAPTKPPPADPNQVEKEMFLHRLSMVNVGATISLACGEKRLTLPDVLEEDFDKATGDRTLSKIVSGVLSCLLKAVIHGKHEPLAKKKKSDSMTGLLESTAGNIGLQDDAA